LADEDDRADAPGVAVISYKLWEREFGRSPGVVGKVLVINSVPVTVVGVAPRRFRGERVLFTPDLWLPMSLQPGLSGANWLKATGGSFNFLDVLVTLRPGVSMAHAQAALAPLYQQLVAQQSGAAREPGQDRLLLVSGRHGITLPQIQDALVEPLRVLMWMVVAVLAIACCNLANLLLARGAARTHEIGVRLAMGAGRTRLVRQLFTESLLLSALGTLLALALESWGTSLLVAWLAEEDLEIGSTLDWHVLGFVAAVSLAATCLFGVAPALAGTRLDIRSALQANLRTGGRGRSRQLLGKAFVVAQVSICLMLLAGATLLARSLWNLERQDWGFRPQGLLIADLPIDMARDLSPEGTKAFAALRQPLYERMNAIPGVRSAALSFGGPLGNNSWTSDISISGRPARHSDYARVIRVSPRYFETMGIQIVTGRALGEGDRETSPRVAVLSQTAARRIFDGADPIGRYISFSPNFEPHDSAQVVGVSHDLRLENPREDPGVVVFAPLVQKVALLAERSMPFNSVVLRTDRDPAALAETVRTALREATHDRALGSIRPVTEVLEDQLAEEETLAELSACLGALALVMAAVGLYGVISYAVTSRTQELGIRLALGASGGQVTGLVMRDVGLLLCGGMIVGAGASVACVRVVRSLLYGIALRDIVWLVLAGLLLVLVAAAAGYLPARRAARLDPLEAHRQE
jgi:predicted permease